MTRFAISAGRKAEFFLILMTMIWGATFLFTRTGTADATPFLFLAVRLTVSGLFFLPVILGTLSRKMQQKGTLDPALRRSLGRGLLLGMLMFSGYGSQTLSLQLTSIAKCSFFTYTFAVIVPPLQFLITGKRLSGRNLIGLVAVVCGVYLFADPQNLHLNGGDLVALVGAVGYAFYILLIDRYGEEEQPEFTTGIQLLTCGLFSLVCCLIFETPSMRFTSAFVIAELYLILPGTVLALYIMNRFQKRTTPVKAVIIYALEPLTAALLGWIVLGEHLTAAELSGGALILAGVLFSELANQAENIPDPYL